MYVHGQVERSQYTEGWSSKNGFTEISRSVPQGGNRPSMDYFQG